MDVKDNAVIKDVACFAVRQHYNTECPKTQCQHWIDAASFSNCSIIAANHGGMTLKQIGDIFGLTRMRVCQIEKSIHKKLSMLLGRDPRAQVGP